MKDIEETVDAVEKNLNKKDKFIEVQNEENTEFDTVNSYIIKFIIKCQFRLFVKVAKFTDIESESSGNMEDEKVYSLITIIIAKGLKNYGKSLQKANSFLALYSHFSSPISWILKIMNTF
jgi:hypothetical protein